MAFLGGMRRAVLELCVWLAVAAAAAFSFHFFEDAYHALQSGWPKMQASISQDREDYSGSDITQSIRARSSAASETQAWKAAELRPTDTADLGHFIERRTTGLERRMTLTANDYGHFVARAEISGVKVDLLTDTGATFVALNYETALAIGLQEHELNFNSHSSTANGIARVAPIMLDYVRIGSIMLRNVEAVVAEPGKMPQNLLGMSFIKRLAGFELSGPTLNITQN